jgi:nitroimidazol reductase NimA-like FMN-containing flavoprotein (pyridoxamine 5'-phosphate oxidase superfamily)
MDGLPPLSATDRTRHRRLREQGRKERAELRAVLSAGFVCHLGVFVNRPGDGAGAPMVVPTVYAFDEENLYLHGSVASRSLLTAAEEAVTACVTITIVDGLVLARSVFEHGVNYRSAMIYGPIRAITEPAVKLAALRRLSEHLAPGQWDYVRRPSRKELAATTVLSMPLTEASVKIRRGPPDDGDSPDAALGLWAGELPLTATWQRPVPDPAISDAVPAPPHIARRAGTRAFPESAP